MITHVIVELKQPVKEEFFHIDTVLPSEYYGYGTPVIRCKDCKYWQFYDSVKANVCKRRYDMHYWQSHEDDFCSRAERKEK